MTTHTLKKHVLLALLILSPVVAYSATGKVQFATGNVVAINAVGESRDMMKGATLEVGDTIKTNGGRAQLRFTDGGYISLQPNTDFKIEEYAYQAQNSAEQKSFFSLVKGGMRAITGLVGKNNKQNYRVNTAVATIGIRGTEFQARLDDTLLVKVGDGAVFLQNEAGDLVLYQGQTGEVQGAQMQPVRSTETLSINAAGPQGGTSNISQEQAQNESSQNNAFSVSEQVNPNTGGAQALANAPIAATPPVILTNYSGPFVGASHFYEGNTGENLIFYGAEAYEDNSALAFDSAGNFVNATNQDGIVKSYSGGATLDKGKLGEDLSWFRLNGGALNSVFNGDTFSEPISNEHIIYGTYSTDSVITSYVSSNLVGTYNLVGGTLPSNSAGVLGTLNSGEIIVNFGALFAQLNMNLSLDSHVYDLNATTNLSSTNAAKLIFSDGTVTTATGCPNGCSFNASGFIGGTSANAIGLAYAVNGPLGGDIAGVAAFEKISLDPISTGP